MAEILVLDVGHGNAAVVLDTAGVTVIDAGPGSTVLETLTTLRIAEVHTLIVSHADADHLDGAAGILANFKVHRVLANADPRGSQAWHHFRVGLADARARTGTTRHALTVDETAALPKGELSLQILHPSAADELGTVMGRDLDGRPLNANSMSGVVRVCQAGRGVALFPGDLDQRGLDRLIRDGADLRAGLLVFPHHGGRPGRADTTQFAQTLTTMVDPERVLFSIGRGKHDNPRPEIVAGVRAAAPRAHVACTQLSRSCAAVTPATAPRHLYRLPARGSGTNPGREAHACCLGTLHVHVSASGTALSPSRADHEAFVQLSAPTARCR